MKRIALFGVLTLALALPFVACDGGGGGGGSCTSICLEAQAQQCTSIDNCSEFCDVSLSLSQKAGCMSEYNAYEDCAQRTPTCQIDATCDSYENAMGNCIAPFCLANMNDPDCVAAANL